MRSRWVAAAGAATGAAVAGYALSQPYRYGIVDVPVPVAASVPALSILHLSDLHLQARHRRLPEFLRELPRRINEVDLVLATGDLIEDDSGIDAAVETLNGVAARLGRFYVLGSHDYYQARFQAFTKYFRTAQAKPKAPRAATTRLEEGLRDGGWVPLHNTSHVVDSTHGQIRIAGVDDPYLRRHRTDHIRRARTDRLAIGLVHAPDVVSEWALAGFDLVVAGHTHAGQVRLPVAGAVVTNSSLPTALAGGLHRVGNMWLHVSPGLGHGKYTPVRFGVRPAVHILQLASS